MATIDLALLEPKSYLAITMAVSTAERLNEGSGRMSPIYCQSTGRIFSTRVFLLFEIPVSHSRLRETNCLDTSSFDHPLLQLFDCTSL